MKYQNNRRRVLFLSQSGLIAALYIVLTLVVGSMGLANGVIQVRVSEALCVLPFFTPTAIPGLTLGCLVSNLLTSAVWQDVVFGTLATLIGAMGAWLCRRIRPAGLAPWLVPLPTVLANTLIIPPVLAYGYGLRKGMGFLMASIGAGELLSAYVLGMVLLFSLRRDQKKLFR